MVLCVIMALNWYNDVVQGFRKLRFEEQMKYPLSDETLYNEYTASHIVYSTRMYNCSIWCTYISQHSFYFNKVTE
jgi:hypothetical protein